MTNDFGLLLNQMRYQNRIFWRTPIAAFFTIVFPLMFLVLFTALFGNEEIEFLGVTTAQYFAPALAVFAAVSATYTNLSIGTAISRDEGILKRFRGTPLPPWIYIASRIASAVWIAGLAVLLMMTIGVVAYGVKIIGSTFAAALLTFLVGVACFAALGMMLSALVPNSDSMPAAANATILPLAFVSDIFIVAEDPPALMEAIGNIFPLKHFVQAFGDAFNPVLEGNGFAWSAAEGEYAIGLHLAVMLAWGILAAIVAIRFFRWEPYGGERRPSRRRNKTREASV
jgi:ABC-2 type transport system permease protein